MLDIFTLESSHLMYIQSLELGYAFGFALNLCWANRNQLGQRSVEESNLLVYIDSHFNNYHGY